MLMQMVCFSKHDQLLVWRDGIALDCIFVAVFHFTLDLGELVVVVGLLYKGSKMFSHDLILVLFDYIFARVRLREYGPHPGIKAKDCFNSLLSKCCIN